MFYWGTTDNDNNGIIVAVKTDELKWLPSGSDFLLETKEVPSNPTSKPKTYTSFSCSQDSLPELSANPIGPKHPDIIIAKLGPGQVKLLF